MIAPSAERPEVSVVVPNYGSVKHLRNVLAALARQDRATFEVIVADDGSPNADELEAVARNANMENLRFLRLAHAGPAAARNAGAAVADGAFLAFTDADCFPTTTWLAELLDVVRTADVVYGRVTTDRGYLFPRWAAPSGECYVSANMLCRAKAFSELGGFRQTFKVPYREDTDFGFRAANGAYRVYCAPQAVVYHPLREQSMKKLWTSGLWHKYDAALWQTFGDSVLADVGKAYTRPIKALGGFSLVGGAITTSIVTSVACLLNGKPWLAAGVLSALAVGLAASTIVATYDSRDERTPGEVVKNGLATLPYVAGWYVGRITGSLDARKFCL